MQVCAPRLQTQAVMCHVTACGGKMHVTAHIMHLCRTRDRMIKIDDLSEKNYIIIL